MKKTRNIAFIVELLLLFVILLFVIVTITRTFMISRSQSLRARHLTEAVILAENIAEVTRGLPDQQSAAGRLTVLDEVREAEAADENTLKIALTFTGEEGRQDFFDADLIRGEEKTEAGSFITEQILIFYGDETDPVYELKTGWYQEIQQDQDLHSASSLVSGT